MKCPSCNSDMIKTNIEGQYWCNDCKMGFDDLVYREPKETDKAYKDFMLSIRKQICDEIRKEFENRYKGKNWNDNIIIGKVCNTINDVLDKIEKGE